MTKQRDFNKSKVDRVCHCGKTFKCQPWSKQVSCSRECAAAVRGGTNAFINEVGNKYNSLTVIRQATPADLQHISANSQRYTWWMCRCDCGGEKAVRGAELRNGAVKSCGCARRKNAREIRICECCGREFEFVDYGINHGPGKTCSAECRKQMLNGFNKPLDLTGRRFGKLVVLEKDTQRQEQGLNEGLQHRIHWKCQCDCGKEYVTSGYNLQHGQRTDCGCVATASQIASSDIPALNKIYHSIRGSARSREIPMELTIEQVRDVITQPCTYCGAPPQPRGSDYQLANGEGFPGHGLDRIDSAKGYVIDNVVSCCVRCNMMKSTLSVDKFREHIQQLHRHLNPAA